MSELKRRLFKVVGDTAQAETSRAEPIEEIRDGIAQLLKQTRERYGQSLRDVSANLRIRMAYLQAIESGRFRELPGPTYAVGFVRSYAEYLGLDAAEIVRRFKGEVEGLDHRTHLSFPEPVPEGKVPGGAIIILSLLVLVIGYGGWYAITSRDAGGEGIIPRLSGTLNSLVGRGEPPTQAAESAPPAAEPAQPGVAASTPAPEPSAASAPAAVASSATSPEPLPAPAASGPGPAEAVPAGSPLLNAGEGASAGLVTASETAPADPEQPPAAGSTEVAPDPAEQVVAVGSTEEEEPPAPEAAAPEAAALPPAPALPEAPQLATTTATAPAEPEAAATDAAAAVGKVVLHARLTSWVQIADASGQPILIRTLAAGESLDVPQQPGLTLFTGNAGGLEILLDGQPLRPLGAVGAVRRGISLDPDALRREQGVE
jgi:cytoskeletal protein RodZ